MSAADLLTASIVFVALPLVFVWSARDSIRRVHVIVLFGLALACGVAALLAFGWTRATPSGLGRLAPALLMLGAGALGGVLLSSAVMSLIALVLRDDDAVAFRREARKYSREPRRPSLAPFSREEINVRFLVSLGSMAAFWICATAWMITSASTPNFVRIVGLYAGPKAPRTLSFAQTPEPYMVQLLLFGMLAAGFSAWTLVMYLRYSREQSAEFGRP
jgi:hypothetical protein